eukprot:6322588-Pyramimonas_sp.AAC.2
MKANENYRCDSSFADDDLLKFNSILPPNVRVSPTLHAHACRRASSNLSAGPTGCNLTPGALSAGAISVMEQVRAHRALHGRCAPSATKPAPFISLALVPIYAR